MSLDKKAFSEYIKDFNFRGLFNEMGWNNDKTTQSINIDNETYTLKAVAEKCGLKILTCKVSNLPSTPTRKKLDVKIRKLFYHYFLVFIDDSGNQHWHIPIKKSEGRDIVTIDYASHQVPEFLYQKVSQLTFSLEQEEQLTIVDVSKLINDSFVVNSEKITKAFYDKFKKEHGAFLQYITGIPEPTNQQWYASLMLNRLMFCYFIQKKGFFDNGNKNYLKDKLNQCQERSGKDKFYSFYRDFLLVLFHKGLNEPLVDGKRLSEVEIEIGNIPYLNGGLFEEHELEKDNPNIEIDDKAFERLFDFFDQYEWHLDTRHTASGKDINPDVIGYIFEKYINDRANMGAYYTKEDITDYISKNCILPYLFDETFRNLRLRSGYSELSDVQGSNELGKVEGNRRLSDVQGSNELSKDVGNGRLREVEGNGRLSEVETELWQIVKQSGDLYIYDAVKKGVNQPLPPDSEVGIQDVQQRTEWNKPAAINYALPTEIWREVVDRRNRFAEVKNKIDSGEINTINDFITYNLNIRQFAQDVIENINDVEFIKQFYMALNNVTIIDPTCGSGAFLFAAMNILEPLYETCLQRMENFVAEKPEGTYRFFEETLAKVKSPEHPNLQYFIYKSIILRNLYGVDIMKEAVEIAKLRLFLKLVATVEADYRKPNLGLEPLPDIDFNIRAGNTLVGFATETELQKGLDYTLDGVAAKPIIEEKCEVVADAFKRYKEIQLTYGDDFNEFKKAKIELNTHLQDLNHELNHLLHKQAEGIPYNEWLKSHQPFHWFAEYYEIIQEKGGFDVIIGNPPYVEYGLKLKSVYTLKDYFTLGCCNLHAYVAERCFNLVSKNGSIGLIVPLPSINTSRMVSLQSLIKPKLKTKGRNVWISAYDERPSGLFEGVDQRLIIELIGKETEAFNLYTTGIKRWYSITRENLFPSIYYSEQSDKNLTYSPSIFKIQNNDLETSILAKFYSNNPISYLRSDQPTINVIYYRTAGGRYWKVVSDKPSGTDTVSEKAAYFRDLTNHQVVAMISSSTFWWYYSCHFDMFNLKDYMIFGFRCSDASSETLNQLSFLGQEYLKSLEQNAKIKTINSKTKGRIMQKQFIVSRSKQIIDKIDTVLAKHYGFTDEELDFIINYDIKYRMGRELEGEE